MNKDSILDYISFLPGPNMNLCYSIYVLASKFVLPFPHSYCQFLFYNFEFLVSFFPHNMIYFNILWIETRD